MSQSNCSFGPLIKQVFSSKISIEDLLDAFSSNVANNRAAMLVKV